MFTIESGRSGREFISSPARPRRALWFHCRCQEASFGVNIAPGVYVVVGLIIFSPAVLGIHCSLSNPPPSFSPSIFASFTPFFPDSFSSFFPSYFCVISCLPSLPRCFADFRFYLSMDSYLFVPLSISFVSVLDSASLYSSYLSILVSLLQSLSVTLPAFVNLRLSLFFPLSVLQFPFLCCFTKILVCLYVYFFLY